MRGSHWSPQRAPEFGIKKPSSLPAKTAPPELAMTYRKLCHFTPNKAYFEGVQELGQTPPPVRKGDIKPQKKILQKGVEGGAKIPLAGIYNFKPRESSQ